MKEFNINILNNAQKVNDALEDVFKIQVLSPVLFLDKPNNTVIDYKQILKYINYILYFFICLGVGG